VSGGEAASPDFVDFGQAGIPLNPCDDPPVAVGERQTAPSAQGGALRSQDLRTPDDPTTLDGAILRVDPDTGEGLPANPFAGSDDPDARRIVGYGLRNPFRFAIRPGTNEVWVGDVGWNTTEEINRLADPTDGTADNFGWPCYEGLIRQGGYDSANLTMCESLYGSGSTVSPFFAYEHSAKVFSEETCPTGTSSVSGMTFAPPGSTLPAEFDGALFFADYARRCIWVMERNGGSLPSPSRIRVFRAGASMPVDIQFGPGNDLFYVDVWGGTIKRIHHTEGNQAPKAVASASATSGATPLAVTFNGSGSSDPDSGDSLSYAWDLDGDGAFDDASTAQAAFAYPFAGTYNVGLRVTDSHGATATDFVGITAGDTPPTATIVDPTDGLTWKVGDPIDFSGSGTDTQDGDLPPSALSWAVVLHHCPSGCHEHAIQTYNGVDHASFQAPDHEHPSYLELRLTVRDSGGLTDTRSIRLDPRTVDLSLASSPSGLDLGFNGERLPAPFTRSVIQGSANTVGAPSPQTLSGTVFEFGSWSDGGSATHSITAGQDGSYTATYAAR
jgi:PKD repeat protein